MNNLQKLRQDPIAYVYRTLHKGRMSLLCFAATLVARCDAALRGVRLGVGFQCWGLPTFRREPGAAIHVGRRCAIRTARGSNNIGLYTRTRISANTRGAVVEIGNNVGLSAVTIAAFERIDIGDDCLIGGNVLITDSDWHPVDPAARLRDEKPHTAPVRIGRNVFIGTRAVILKGTTIGDGAVIGAGSVVSGTIPPRTVAVGNPCRVVRSFS